LHGERDSNGSVRIVAAIGKSAVDALEKRLWVVIPERQRTPQKSQAIQSPAKGKNAVEPPILAPARVLEVEVLGRAWQGAISSSGVPIETSRLRARTLVERT
jgi:hypothetical protein